MLTYPLPARVKHGEKNYIPENFLPQDLNFVLWGHEHKCEIDPVKVGSVVTAVMVVTV